LREVAELIEETPRSKEFLSKVIGRQISDEEFRDDWILEHYIWCAKRELAKQMAIMLLHLYEGRDVADEDFDEAVDLIRDEERVVRLYRLKNVVVVRYAEESRDDLYFMVMAGEEVAREVAERARIVARCFGNVDFPIDFFYSFYSRDALYYIQACFWGPRPPA